MNSNFFLRLCPCIWGLVAITSFEVQAAEPFKLVLRQQQQDGVNTYRIPGLATSKAGTLLAVFDLRHKSAADLPADIDVGFMRSTSHGQNWDKMQTILDFDAKVANSRGNGVGDPAIAVDSKTGTIYVMALWSKGNRAWNGSGPGLTEEETGQLVVTKSTDDGISWSKPVNITQSIQGRNPQWRLCFNGPGSGIFTKEGVLVFAAQFRDEKGVPHSCILWTKDEGVTWQISAAAIPQQPPTSEAQVVQVADGKLLLTMRDESRSGKRLWAYYVYEQDIAQGKWEPHWSDLPDPTCMASITALPDGKLVFANPASSKSRSALSIRISDDQGKSWSPAKLLDAQPSAYSCLTVLPNGEVAILYETGKKNAYETLTFARFPLNWLRP